MEPVKQDKPGGTPQPFPYNSIVLRLALAVTGSYIIVARSQPQSFFDVLFSSAHYKALAIGSVIAFVLVTYVGFIHGSLYKKLAWEKHGLERAAYQFALGVVVPGIVAYLTAVLYFFLQGTNLAATTYLDIDFPLVMAMLLCLNLYYTVAYLATRLRAAEIIKEASKPVQPEKEHVIRETFLVHTPVRVLPLRTEQICYFFRKNGQNFVHTFDSDVYAIPEALKEIEERFAGPHFFRISRQMIVNFEACVSFRPGKNKTLELTLKPPFSLKHRDEETHNNGDSFVTVSEDRVQAFKSWIGR